MLVIIKHSKRRLKRYLRKCIAFSLFILGILSIPLLSVVLIMPRGKAKHLKLLFDKTRLPLTQGNKKGKKKQKTTTTE